MRKGRVESPITTNHLTLTRAPGPGAERVVARVDSEWTPSTTRGQTERPALAAMVSNNHSSPFHSP